jgi:hypothetical protein
MPTTVWEHVECDGKDMPQDEYGYNYVWVFVCKLSRIIATLPGNKTDTAEVLAGRYFRQLYRFFGLPAVWITDNAGPFISSFMAEINRLTGTKHRHSSAFHPQTQGGVEVTNQYLDQNLRFYVDKYQKNWSVQLPALDFAHNSSWHSAIDMAPLKVALGRDVRNPLSLDVEAERPQAGTDAKKRALELVEAAQLAQKTAHKTALATQKKQEAQANKKRRPVDFTVGDRVFLSRKGFSTEAATTRLDAQWSGPFEIIAERGYSYVLDLPASYKMKNLFHADRLRKADDNPLPQQHQTPPPPEEVNGEPEWEVEYIERSRALGRPKRLEYQARWKGCDPDDTWYPASNFRNAPIALKIFHDAHPEASGPPVNLQKWIDAAAADRQVEDDPSDEKPVTEAKRIVRRHK